ncbi:hypothetical protein ACWEQ3_51835 [Streptomyces mirabilis]
MIKASTGLGETPVSGVLGALYGAVGLGHGTEAATWPTPELAAMLHPDAHDWVDPNRWDLWCYENYPAHRQAMRRSWPNGSTLPPSSRGAAVSPPSSVKASWGTPLP